MRRGRIAAALVLLAAAGCAGTRGAERDAGPRERDALVGYEWRLVAVESRDSDEDRTPVEPTVYTLELRADGRVLVRADCNRGEGHWKRDGSKLWFPDLVFTQIDCGFESLFEDVAQGLASVEGYAFRDGHLFLLEAGSNELLEYEPAQEDAGDAR